MLVAGIGHSANVPRGGKAGVQARQQQADQTDALIKAGLDGTLHHRIKGFALQNILDAVILMILAVQHPVGGEVPGNLGMAQVLADDALVHRQVQLVGGLQKGREVLPPAGGDELHAVHIVLDFIKMLGPQFQIGRHGGVQAVGAGVLLPDAQLRLNVDAPHAVQRDQVELPHAFVVLRRVAGGHDDPPGGHGLVAEGLALQKLQHRGGQRLTDAVDLINKQNAVLFAGALHSGVHAGDDLAHRVLGHAAGLARVAALPDKRQADGALAGVVGDGVGHQRNAALLGDLLHDLGLADARRAHQQDGALAYRRDQRCTGVIAGKVSPHGLFDFLFRTLNIHSASSFRRGFAVVLLN